MTIVEFNNAPNNDADYKSNTTKIKKCLGQDTIVLVWATWCPHCTTMKDDWKLLKDDVGKKVNVVEIESGNLDRIRQQSADLYNKIVPQGDKIFFPTIKLYKGNKSKLYEEERSFPVMKKHITKHYSKAQGAKAVKKPVKKPVKVTKKVHKGGADNTATATNATKIKDIRKIQTELNTFIQNVIQKNNSKNNSKK
jgi:thiol-disulfide isomerase/thioredoxin